MDRFDSKEGSMSYLVDRVKCNFEHIQKLECNVFSLSPFQPRQHEVNELDASFWVV
jgi:hypothetical protein